MSLEPRMLLTTQNPCAEVAGPKLKEVTQDAHVGQTVHSVRKRPLREVPREQVKGLRQLQKQVVLDGDPCKEKSK